jgi:ATP-dependent protease ClpP protease subunit
MARMQEVKKDNNDEKKLNSTEHTLFKKKISGSEKQEKNGLYRKEPGYTRYRFFVSDFMEFERGLHEIYNELWDAGENDKLELRINSNGGMVNEGAQFYSIIKNKFNGRTTTILDNKGYSMGALAFCMGDKRVVTERADLMFHDYSGGLGGKGGEIQSRNEHTQKFIRKFFKEVIFNQGFLTKKEYKNMLIGQDYWMDAEEMCERGIATHVIVNGKEIKAEIYLSQLRYVGEKNETEKQRKKKILKLSKSIRKDMNKRLKQIKKGKE